MNRFRYIIFLAFVLVISCNQNEKKWEILFDGTSLDGWRAYNGDKIPPGWTIKGDELTFDTEVVLESNYNYKGSKDLVYGTKEFENFELYLEWKIPEAGNSGIFYHVKEGYPGIPDVSPEYQIIDDEGYVKVHDITEYNRSVGFLPPEVLHPLQKTASDYAMYAAKEDKKLNPVGEWNSSKILFTTEKVEYWLNGEVVLSFEPWSEDWVQRKTNGKWKSTPDYGKAKKGYIGLQDHGSGLSFRNIKIREL